MKKNTFFNVIDITKKWYILPALFFCLSMQSSAKQEYYSNKPQYHTSNPPHYVGEPPYYTQNYNNNQQYNNNIIKQNIAGSLDTSFNPTSDRKGYIISNPPIGTSSQARAVATQPNNAIIIAGIRDNRAVLVRYNQNGLDTRFGGVGGNGIVIKDLTGKGGISFFNTLVIQKDKKMVAAGQSDGYLAVARYYENGTLDTLFGDKGIVKTTQRTEITALALQQNNIIACGHDNSGAIVLTRFDKHGTLDTNFGREFHTPKPGIVLTKIGNGARANAIAIQKDNKIVVVGLGNQTQMAIVRYTENGDLDTTFGPVQTGVVTIAIENGSSAAYGVAIQEDGKIVIVGQSQHSSDGAPVFTTIRLHEDGALDTSFGSHDNGVVTTRPRGAPYPAYARSVALTEDKKIIVMGYVNVDNRNSFTLVRYNKHGVLDTDFGVQGIQSNILVNTNTVPNHSVLPVVGILQNDKTKLVLAGNYAATSTATSREFAVARYWA